jgi:hypothetical protein
MASANASSELETSAKDEKPTEDQKFGPNASSWLAKVTKKVAGGGIELAGGAGIELVIKALSAFYGLPG